MAVSRDDVQQAFEIIRSEGIAPNRDSTKWDIIDPQTRQRFPPKVVLRIAKRLAGDHSALQGGGWPTNDPLQELGFEIVLKPGGENNPELASDIEEVIQSDVDETTKQRLVNARLGQGGFREALVEIWGGKCALTGCDIGPVLRASHIKPWRISTNPERLDPRNGILLAASLDALFDKCLISLTPEGRLLASADIGISRLEMLGIKRGTNLELIRKA